jgi:ABC-2 type transport system ATP-binding protein
MSLIQLSDVRVRYGDKTVLDGVGLEVDSSETVGLLGPNGAGKTTLTRILLGLEAPETGEVSLYGADPRTDPSVRKRVGYAPEVPPFDESVSGRNVLAGYARLMGVPREQAFGRADSLLSTVGLTDAAEQAVGEYSKGMKQRLNLARSLVHDPDLVVLDEPTSGLDPAGKTEIRELVQELADQGKTVLLSTHEMPSVTQTGAQPVILSNGRLHRREPTTKPDALVATYEEVTTRGDDVVFVPEERS